MGGESRPENGGRHAVGMQPKRGIALGSAVVDLRRCAIEARNVSSSSIGTIRLRDDYLQWADQAERVLRSLFTHFRLADLHTDRFWHIRDIAEETARPYDLIYPEVRVQAERLEQLADALEAMEKRLASAVEHIAVPDTNVFLHFQVFNTIDWAAVVGSTPVRLVIPLRVIEELDLKKASSRRDLARRARNVLALLESLVGPTAGLPAQINDSATVEVLLDHDLDSLRQDREPSADTEILDACEFLSFVTGQPVSLVTGDVSMRLRAAVRGWTAVPMPDALRATLDIEGGVPSSG